MGDDGAEVFPRKPRVQVESRRLDLEGGFTQFRQVQIDCVVRRWTDRGRYACKHRECCTMNMSGTNQLYPRMTAHDGRKLAGVEEILAVHVPDAGLKRRMVQEQQRGPVMRRRQRRIKPLQRGSVELSMRLSVDA